MNLPVKHLIEDSKFYKHLTEKREILLSSSTLAMIEACDVKGVLGAVLELTKPYESNDLNFGSLVHEGIAHYHKSSYDGFEKTEDFMESHDLYSKIHDEKGYKTAEKALELVEKYIEQFQEQDPYEVLINLNGKPMCEIPFKIFLGTFHTVLRDIKVYWTGTIDLVVKRHGKIWCLDHKTTKQLGPGFINKYLRSNQFIGYYQALHHLFHEERLKPRLPARVEGALLNALCIRKHGVEIPEPYQLPFSTRQLPEWGNEIITKAKKFVIGLFSHDFDTNRNSCCLFGKCKYWDVCQAMSPEVRVKILEGDEFVKSGYSVFEK